MNRIAIFIGTILLAIGVLLFGREWYVKTINDFMKED